MISKEIPLSFYPILGFIKNYGGGLDIDKGTVQVLYQEDKPRIKYLRSYCDKFFTEVNLQDDTEWEENERGFTSLRSKIICEQIGASVENTGFLVHDYMSVDSTIFQPIKEYFNEEDLGKLQRKAFLIGAVCSHLISGELRFYNEYNKAMLVHHIFYQLAGDEDEITMQSFFNIPYYINISLNSQGKLHEKYIAPFELLQP